MCLVALTVQLVWQRQPLTFRLEDAALQGDILACSRVPRQQTNCSPSAAQNVSLGKAAWILGCPGLAYHADHGI